jgi:hypothetical protein
VLAPLSFTSAPPAQSQNTDVLYCAFTDAGCGVSQELLRRVSTWLRPEGKLFVHIFLHKSMPYHFEV